MTASERSIETLQRFIDGYPADIAVIEAALEDTKAPEPARRALAGGLNYVLDLLDIFPDHYQGLGLVDDVLVLRLAAKAAAAAGVADEGVKRLADESAIVGELLGELATPLEGHLQHLGDRSVRGRTVAQIVASKDVLASLLADIGRQVKQYRPQKLIAETRTPDWILGELRLMVRHELRRAGVLPSA